MTGFEARLSSLEEKIRKLADAGVRGNRGSLIVIANIERLEARLQAIEARLGPTETWHFTGDMPKVDPDAPKGKGEPMEIEHRQDDLMLDEKVMHCRQCDKDTVHRQVDEEKAWACWVCGWMRNEKEGQ